MSNSLLLNCVKNIDFSNKYIEISNDSYAGFEVIDNFFSTVEILSDSILKKDKRRDFLLTEYFKEKIIDADAYIGVSDRLKETIDESIFCIGSRDVDGLISARNTFSDIKKEIEKLEEAVYTDDLTKLKNKRFLDKKILDEQSLFKKDGYLFLLDIKNLRDIRNLYGRNIADNVLSLFSTILVTKLQDNLNHISLIRTYEDEFLILSNNKDISKILLTNLLELIEEMLKKIITLKASKERISINIDCYFQSYQSGDYIDHILEIKKNIKMKA